MTEDSPPFDRSVIARIPGTVLAVCFTVVFVTVVVVFGFLAATGADATEFRQFLNTALNVGGYAVGVTGALAAGAAAKSSGAAAKSAARTVEQTNGALDARMQAAFKSALDQHLIENP